MIDNLEQIYLQLVLDQVKNYINIENNYESGPIVLLSNFDYTTKYIKNNLVELIIIIYKVDGTIFSKGIFTGNGLNSISVRVDKWLERTFKTVVPRNLYLNF